MPTKLTREFRFFLQPGQTYTKGNNPWNGAGGSFYGAPFWKLRITVGGPVDSKSGYLINIQILDSAIADFLSTAVPHDHDNKISCLEVCQETIRIQKYLPTGVTLLSAELQVSPGLSFTQEFEVSMDTQITEQFEFSAAHRLHCDELSAEENRRIFGKCNHLHGHGHNYIVAISMVAGSSQWSFLEFERLVKELIIDPFDHKFLNLDIAEFKSLNPSVENIAKVIWHRLIKHPFFATLRNVRVYETPKTWADYSDAPALP